MAAKWQQWMPFHIDRFRASPAVQAMHPAARAGYLYLLAYQWQSDDGTVSDDPFELSENSGLGDEMWAIYGERILRNFEDAGAGKLRNQVCHDEWLDAKRVFEARKSSADLTNSKRLKRSPSRSPVRSAHTRTTVVPVGVPVPVSVVLPEEPALDHVDIARRVGEECGVTSPQLIREIQEQAKLELASGRIPDDIAAEFTASIQLYRGEKSKLRITWGLEKFIGEGHWRDPTGWPRKDNGLGKDIYQQFVESDA